MFALCLAVDARVRLGLNFLYAELVAPALLASVLFRSTIDKARPFILIALFAVFLLVCATISVTDDQQATFSSARNIVSGLIILLAFAMVGFEASTKLLVMKAFVLAGLGVSLLGIHQALFGLNQSVTVFSIGLVDTAQGGVSFALEWKLNNLIKSGLVSFQKSLAIGLHQYSNNFAEYLIYVLIATLALRASRSISQIFFCIAYLLLFSAVLLSQSRTCQIAFVVFSVVHFLWNTRNVIFKSTFVVIFVIIVIFTMPYIISALSYDGFGTVQGREQLNSNAINAMGYSIKSIIFGGHVREYYTNFIQDPHNMFLYMALQFGIPFTILSGVFFLYILYQLLKPAHDETPVERALRRGGVLASCWLLSYGLTWSVISVGASGMTWAMLTGMALPRRWREQARPRTVEVLASSAAET